MTLDTIAKAIRNTIRDAASIINECLSLFGKRHRVFYASDGAQSPTVEDCPVFMVHPVGKSVGMGSANQTFTIKLGLGIVQTDPTVSTNDVEFSGAQRIEDLLDLALVQIQQISPNILLDGIDFEIGSVDEFPILVGEMTLTITVAKLLGAQLTL
jgi:hypothetical protein